jgi:hypothetical protein
MISTDKFKKDDRVKISPFGFQMLKPRKPFFGTVVGFSGNPLLVWIRKDNQKSAGSYYIGYWSLIKPRLKDRICKEMMST